MHPADIKAELEKAGSSQSAIARSVKGRAGKPVTPGAVYLVIKGLSKSVAIARRISEVIKRPVKDIWPGRYPELEFFQRLPAAHQAELERSAAHMLATAKAPAKKQPAKKRAAPAPAAAGAAPIVNLIEPAPIPPVLGVRRDAKHQHGNQAAPKSKPKPDREGPSSRNERRP